MVQNTVTHPEYSPRSIVRAMVKHWVALILTWTALGTITAVIILKWPATYRAEALILVDSQKIPEKYVAPTVATDLQDRLATINQQIQSSDRLKKLIEAFDLYKDERKTHFQEEIIEKMRKDIQLTAEKGWARDRPGAFKISYQGPVPTVVAEVANRLANMLIDENLKTRETQASGTSEFLDSQLKEAKKKLDDLELKVSKYKLEHNGELPQQEVSLNGILQRLQLELQGEEEAVNRAQQTKVILENTLGMAESAQASIQRMIGEPSTVAGPDTQAPPAGVTAPRPTGVYTRSQASAQLQLALDAMLVQYGPDHPDVKRARAELERAKALEAKEAAGGNSVNQSGDPDRGTKTLVRTPNQTSPELFRQLAQEREKVSNLGVQLNAMNRELETRSNSRKRIIEAIALYQKRLEKLPIREQEMEGITRDYENSKAEYRSLLEKRTSAEMATEMERRQKAENFRLLDPARVPEMPLTPKVPLLSVVGGLLTFALGVAFALGLELKKNCLLGEWELPAGVLTIGRVPVIEFAGATAGRPAPRRWRRALLPSAAIPLLGGIAGVVYYLWGRR
jgi:polysaccharide chain length determinant protein (PEP-CTERM system associated)